MVRSVLGWSGITLHQIFFEKYVLGNALIACFEAVSGIYFYKLFNPLVIFLSHRIYLAAVTHIKK